MRTIWQDLRYGARLLWKRPGFTLIVVITLGLGIGANTAIFSVVNAALLQGMPYREPDTLVHLWERTPQQSFPRREASYPDFLDWRQAGGLSVMTAYGGCSMTLEESATREPIPCARVAANFFSLLGVTPMLGRAFQESEDQLGAPRVLLLSYSAWQRRFDGDPQLVGKTLRLNDEAWTVIGVLPPSFHFAPRGASEIWAPLNPTAAQRANRRAHWVNIIARLAPRITAAQAEAELQVIGARIARDHADTHAGTSIQIVPLADEVIGRVRPLMLALLGAVGVVLLIACANIAGLLLVRGAARRKEVAVRLALGAGRFRLVRQWLTESLLLAGLGGALGLLVAQFGIEALVAAIPDLQLSAMPYLQGLALDGRMLAFTGGLSLLTGLVFGLVPALHASRANLHEVLKEGGRSSASAGSQRLRQALVVGEIALALVLLSGAGLMLNSLYRLWRVNPGFNPQNLLAMSVGVDGKKYANDGARAEFQRQLLARLNALPGVQGAAAIDLLPLVGGNTTRCYAADRPIPAPGNEVEANTRTVSANYFAELETPLRKGRAFSERDTANAPGVVIINETLAQRVFPNEEAVGRRLIFPGASGVYEVVGIAGDEKVNGLAAPPPPVVYGPFAQNTDTNMVLMIRTADDPLKAAEWLRRASREVEPGLVIYFARSFEELAASLPATFIRRYPAALLSVFALTALLLAGLGLYGVIAYTVVQRTHEIGIRMALGAQSLDVLTLVMRQGLALTLLGLGVGILAALALTRWLASLLFGVGAADPLTFTLVTLLLASIALLACWIPARRATKVDPLVALRAE